MKISKIIIFFILISICKCVQRFYNFTENEFIDVSNESKNTTNKWLMIFLTLQYHDYDKFMDLIKKDIFKFYEKDENIKFGFIQMNKDNSKWLANIFNIKSIPFLLLVYKGRIYYFKDNSINFETIIKFINGKKSFEDSHPIPDKITIKTKVKILFKMFINDLNDNIQELLNRFNINYKWNINLTILVFGLLTLLFFIVEIYMIKSCCMKSYEYDDFEKIKNKAKKDKKKVE